MMDLFLILLTHECVLEITYSSPCRLQDLFAYSVVCLMLIVCMAVPTESPGHDQRGVRGFAQLEAGELEES